MATEADIITLKEVIKKSGANIEVEDFGTSVEEAEEYPDDDLVYIEMANGNRSKVRITPSHRAHLKAYGDPKFHQIVLNVQEPKRKITRNVGHRHYITPQESDKSIIAKATKTLKTGEDFGVRLPSGTTYEVLSINIDLEQPYGSHVRALTAAVKATIPKSDMHFLIGQDENAMFVCVLPKAVRTVARAHDVLRPKGVPKDALRQGEFFFVPASAAVSTILDNKVLKRVDRFAYGSTGHFLDENESHAALMFEIHNGDDYVLGFVADTDQRHVPIFFDEWHKVVHNLEVQPPTHMEIERWD